MIPYAAADFKALFLRMSLTLEDVMRVARLARIAIEEPEARVVLTQLNGVFRLIEQMQAVDTSGIEPMSHALDVVQRLREDRVTESNQHAQFQAIAPRVESELYLVPKVIE